MTKISGKLQDSKGNIVPNKKILFGYYTVTTDNKGLFHIDIPMGTYNIVINSQVEPIDIIWHEMFLDLTINKKMKIEARLK